MLASSAARRVLATGSAASCCGPVNSCCGGAAFNGQVDPITSNLYVNGETDELPSAAVLASLGCGNPTALAQLHPGEVVLDLGSGVGNVVMQASLETGCRSYGIEIMPGPAGIARSQLAQFRTRCRMWGVRMGEV